MMMKRLIITILYAQSMLSGAYCAAENSSELINDFSGDRRITHIINQHMQHTTHLKEVPITYAQVRNIEHDLSLAPIAAFFECKTLMGQTFLQRSLASPLSPQDKSGLLRYRQHMLNTLVSDPVFKNRVEEILSSVKEYEDDFKIILSDSFMGRNCPELQALNALKQHNPGMYPFFEFITTNPYGKMILNAMSVVGTGFTLRGVKTFGHLTYLLAPHRACVKPALFTGYLGLMASFSIYNLMKEYRLAATKRNKIHALNRMIHAAQELEKLCAEYTLETQFKVSDPVDEQAHEVIEQIKHSRYARENSWFFNTPMVHGLLYKMYQHPESLANFCMSIAEMDAYNALANKIIAQQDKSNSFCFAHFLAQRNPAIQVTNFWHILVKNPLLNSLDEENNIILTGPNAGGKTTAIKALLQNIVLAQTFGIAAGSTFVFTPYDIIHAYLTISDDILQGMSLFVSEMNRAQQIGEIVSSLAPDQLFFFALDELFTGTVADDGEVCAFKFIEKMSACPQIQCIYATHFKKLTELESQHPRCVNYMVGAPVMVDKTFVYPFTLHRGINHSHIALDMARNHNLF